MVYPTGLAGEKEVKVDLLLGITTMWYFGTSGFDEIAATIQWFVGDTIWTQQLPRVAREIAPYLIEWYPQLEVERGVLTKENHLQWLENFKAQWGNTLLVAPIPQDDHTKKSPVQELIDMGFESKIISIDLSDDNDDESPYGTLPYKREE